MVEEEKKKALEIALKAVVDKFGRKLSKHKLFMNEGEIKKSGITMSEKKTKPTAKGCLGIHSGGGLCLLT